VALIECVPNFSEGRRPEVINEIAAAVASVDAVGLLDRQSDETHNRCVLTFVGEHEAAAEAAFRAIAAAARLIDLNQHWGAHPRFGATDVVPFVPIRAGDMPVCVATAHQLGRRVASELEIPVYFYEDAARTSERRNLVTVRAGEFEGLRDVIESDPSRVPDEGPARIHPTAGAVAIGARPPLIAYNVNLVSDDLELARRIAREVRERDGGLPKVKAIGLALEQGVQISMNLTDYRVTGVLDAYAAVRDRAAAAGVEVAESEVVGLLPLDALVGLGRAAIHADAFSDRQVLEARVLDRYLESSESH
jgi:glutamate formiminotransferase